MAQMMKVLSHVAKKERFHLPQSAADAIITTSNGNMRKALLVFEAMKMQRPDLSGDIEVAKPDWETYCGKVADLILAEQTPSRLLEVRGKVYELLSHCIPPHGRAQGMSPDHSVESACSTIQTISERIVEKVDDSLKQQIVHWAAHYVSPSVRNPPVN